MRDKDVTKSAAGISRTIGSTTYEIPGLDPTPVTFSPGIFMWLPFANFEYVLPKDGRIDPRVEKAIEDGVNIVCVDEVDE